ncbi:MAG: VCBS repeat-containing protein [Phycisphaerales bacterium]|nr:MAG: VCBS repeat-containing protein [Phycisphaerales bacterium]
MFTFSRVPDVPLLSLATVITFSALASMCPAEPTSDPHDVWQAADAVVRTTNRGVALMERYEYAEAVKIFEEATRLAPDSVEIRINLAIAMYNRCAQDDLKKAAVLLDAAIEKDPGNARALYFRGIMHQHEGRDDLAIPCFQRVLKIRPHDAFTWYLLARSKSHLGQSSRSDLERAVQENPNLVSAYYDLIRAARQEDDREGAQAYMKKFTKMRESPLAETVVMPQYRRMGPLATVEPLPGTPKRSISSGELSAGRVREAFEGTEARPFRGFEADQRPSVVADIISIHGIQSAMADVNGDGHVDIITTAAVKDGQRRLALLLGQPGGTFADSAESSGLTKARGVISCALGDYDNDGHVDLFAACAGPNHLFRGRGDGTFEDVTDKADVAGPEVISISAVFLDADHDADLDIYVCNAGSANRSAHAVNQLLNNNTDGTFTDIAKRAGVACESQRSITLAPADIDGDRDTDLAVFNWDGSTRIFFNERFGEYHEGRINKDPVEARYGGVLQDFNADGRVDLLSLPGAAGAGRLYLADGAGTFLASTQFDGAFAALATRDALTAARVADVDLDGDLDVAVFGKRGHVLLNDGWGRFLAKPDVWPAPTDDVVIGQDLVDLTGDGVPDLLQISARDNGRVLLTETRLTPPANWLSITPTGDRGDDKSTRSPASGYGTLAEVRCGLHTQVMTYTGLNGGLSQCRLPMTFGLDGAAQADFLALTWPDGVTQYEHELAARTHHHIKETERRISSCPVLFAWDGNRFGFIGDFAGVGGLGYLVARGEYAMPQVLEHVKIGPTQLAPRNGFYELRLTEPMEEVAYVDRLELLAVDHPAGTSVYPDERLILTGPSPTHKLLYVDDPVFPVRAMTPDGVDCTGQLRTVDRKYAYHPQLDPRFTGFCRRHSLIVDFGDRLTNLDADQNVYLFLTGSIEYPYSQTTYAARQAGVMWEPVSIEQRNDAGQWETIVPDAGMFGGMGRTITVDLAGKLSATDCILRLTTNIEVYYDQLFIANDRGAGELTISTAPLASTELRRLGFPSEYSPDGEHPYIYTYDVIEPTSSFKMPAGRYTAYGQVQDLLAEFDDQYVILGSGDEIALRFDSSPLPPVRAGYLRSFVLVSHAYCKDMDLYTGAPDTVEPLPFKDMSAYPYPSNERHPNDTASDRRQERVNTRLVE